jgi:pyrroline-5-carboxylate reductase
MKVGFIGCGNMARAIIKGMVVSNAVEAGNIFIYDLDNDKILECSREFSAIPVSNIEELIDSSDTLVIAVKPAGIAPLLNKIRDKLMVNNPLIISIAAGKTLEFIESNLPYKPLLVRVMPNINAKVGESMSAYCDNGNISAQQESDVVTIFSSVGKLIKLEESHFPVFGVIAGSAPAFACMFMDSLARAAVKNGMSKVKALDIVTQTVLGSAKLIMEGDEHPWSIIDSVCSPGGTTIEGITSLQADGFESAVERAVCSAVEKDKRI